MAATNINRVVLTGNLTRDPELRSLQSGLSVCSMRIACNTRRKNNATGEWEDKPNYFDVTVWGAQGENCARFLAKGRPVALDGRLEWREWQGNDGAKRTVAQLNFADFVSAASFNTNQVNGGNADLVPQRSWELLLSADRVVLGDGRIKVELGYNRVALVQDRVPVPGGLDAPGNLGDGEAWIARGNLDLPLARLGLTGMRLSLYGSYVNTAVQDPYTLFDRQYSGNARFSYTGELRQDLGKFAWGASMQGNSGSTHYRLAETDMSQGVSPTIGAFAEYRPSARTTLTLGATNLLNSPAKRWRFFYVPDRTTLAPDEQEYRQRSGHRRLYVTVKHSFG